MFLSAAALARYDIHNLADTIAALTAVFVCPADVFTIHLRIPLLELNIDYSIAAEFT